MDKFITRFFVYLSLFMVPAAVSGQSFKKADPAPPLKILTLSGDTADLEKLKGKIVLVEFWASWCGPCRVRNRNLVAVYNKYRECGFEILCASADENHSIWKKAVIADNLDCLQGKMSKGWSSKELRDWKVRFLPASYLVDKDGKFIAIEPSIGVINAWLEELL